MSEVEQQTQNILYNICIMLDQRRRRWADVVQMLYKCFVFAGTAVTLVCKAKRQYLPNCKVSKYFFFWIFTAVRFCRVHCEWDKK